MQPRPLSIALLALAPLAARASAQNVLRNGDFEAQGSEWMTIFPPHIQDPRPSFEYPKDAPHGGKRSGLITTHKAGGFTSFTQRITSPPKKATLAKVTGWVRAEELGEESSAALLLLFIDPDDEAGGGMNSSVRLTEVGDWARLQVEAMVPEGATGWMVRCGIYGDGRVAFDDIEVTYETGEIDLVPAALAVHHATYVVRAKHNVKEPGIAISIPFPFEGQAPLAVRVTSDPPDQVARLEILEERENRPLRIVLKPQERGAEVELRAETLVLVADRPISDGAEVELAKPRKVPKDVKTHLSRAPGIDLGDKTVKKAAESFDRTDLDSLMKDLNEYLRANLEYDGGRTQGAAECLEEGKAVCTGYANVAASLLIAANVPTRILACTQLTGRLQEHYIVQVWTPDLGWSRAESTMAVFPWKDSMNLVLRIVYPDSKRSRGDVPLYFELSGGATGGFDMQEDTCWQGADTLGRWNVDRKSLEWIDGEAREDFERLIGEARDGDHAPFAPRAKAGEKRKLTERGMRILETMESWLKE